MTAEGRAYKPKRPLTWITSHRMAREYDCRSMWEAYNGAQYVGTVMDFGYASYGSIFGERLGASQDVEDAKARVNWKYDKLWEKPEVNTIGAKEFNDTIKRHGWPNIKEAN